MTLRQGAGRLLTGGLGRPAALGVGFAVAGVAAIWAATSTGLAWTLTGVTLVLVSPLVGRAFMMGAVMTPTHLKVRRVLTTRTFAKAAPGGGFDWGNGTGALVVAKNGNRPAAALGARHLRGTVQHG